MGKVYSVREACRKVFERSEMISKSGLPVNTGSSWSFGNTGRGIKPGSIRKVFWMVSLPGVEGADSMVVGRIEKILVPSCFPGGTWLLLPSAEKKVRRLSFVNGVWDMWQFNSSLIPKISQAVPESTR